MFCSPSICVIEMPGSIKWDEDIKMSFLLYTCVSIYTAPILTQSLSWRVPGLWKTKKRFYYSCVVNGKLIQKTLVQVCIRARKARPILLNPILKLYTHK